MLLTQKWLRWPKIQNLWAGPGRQFKLFVIYCPICHHSDWTCWKQINTVHMLCISLILLQRQRTCISCIFNLLVTRHLSIFLLYLIETSLIVCSITAGGASGERDDWLRAWRESFFSSQQHSWLVCQCRYVNYTYCSTPRATLVS